ncbi:MAG: M56 family metallopeptidase, partial [Pirellulales bacterium]|nr:M56 family metallopeptidase [Pirellulales bacterium]
MGFWSDLTFAWLWQTTWQVSLAVLIILCLQFVLRPWLAPRWCYALWLLIVARLMLPMLPASSLSVYRLVSDDLQYSGGQSFTISDRSRGVEDFTAARSTDSSTDPLSFASASSAWGGDGAFLPAGDAVADHVVSRDAGEVESAMSTGHGAGVTGGQWREMLPRHFNLSIPTRLLLLIWMAGVAVMLFRLAGVCRAQRRTRARAQLCDDDRINELFVHLCDEIGLQRRVELFVTTDHDVPYVQGVWKPVVMLPKSLCGNISHADLRWVLRHELQHVRRRDLVVVWVMLLLQSIHWFNPMLWLAFRRLRDAQELRCDQDVIEAAGGSHRETARRYGRALVDVMKTIQLARAGQQCQALGIGLGFRRSTIQDRVVMMTRKRKHPFFSFAVGAVVMLFSAGGVLTQSKTDAQQAESSPPPTTSDSPQQAHVIHNDAEPRHSSSFAKASDQAQSTAAAASSFDAFPQTPSRQQVERLLIEAKLALLNARNAEVAYELAQQDETEKTRIKALQQLRKKLEAEAAQTRRNLALMNRKTVLSRPEQLVLELR